MRALARRIVPQRPAPMFRRFAERFRDAEGIEVGGPSGLFEPGSLLPVYDLARHIDNCQFATQTVWQGAVQAGWSFRFHPRRPPGYQHVMEATALSRDAVARGYGFVLASHVIEHLANPAFALRQWRTLLDPGGVLLAVLPNPRDTFDHRRQVTPIAHLIEDYDRDVGEDDLTHLDEILALHDLDRDPPAGSPEAFRVRSLDNVRNRCLHHHVFSLESATALLSWCGYRVDGTVEGPPPHFILVATRETA